MTGVSSLKASLLFDWSRVSFAAVSLPGREKSYYFCDCNGFNPGSRAVTTGVDKRRKTGTHGTVMQRDPFPQSRKRFTKRDSQIVYVLLPQ